MVHHLRDPDRYIIATGTGIDDDSQRNKKAQLSLGKERYSLYSSCCSTDLL